MGWMLSPILYQSRSTLLMFYCPGCKDNHPIWLKLGEAQGWQWNHNPKAPSISPSLKVEYRTGKICHLTITDGVIHFCEDSWHDLRNQHVPMVPYKKEDRESCTLQVEKGNG